jgi:hypothetical protein
MLGTFFYLAGAVSDLIPICSSIGNIVEDDNKSSRLPDYLVIAAQSLKFVSSYADWKSNTQIAFSVLSNASNVIQTASQKAAKRKLDASDWIELGTTTGFAISTSTKDTIRLSPGFFGEWSKTCEVAAQIIYTFSGGTVLFVPLALGIFRSFTQPKPVSRHKMPVIHSNPLQQTDKYKQQQEEAMRELARFEEIKQMREIPVFLINDEILRKYKCGITQKPIRTIVVVKGTEGDRNPVYYEESKIREYSENIPPPKWPKDTEFNQDLLIPCEKAQDEINKQLQKALDLIHKKLRPPQQSLTPSNEVRALLKALAQQLNSESSSSKLADSILKNLGGSVSWIAVEIVRNQFDRARKETRKITLCSNVFTTPSHFDQTKVCNVFCAILGDKTKLNDLKSALMANKKLEFYISKDVENISFNWSDYQKKTNEVLLNQRPSQQNFGPGVQELLKALAKELKIDDPNYSSSKIGDSILKNLGGSVSWIAVETVMHLFKDVRERTRKIILHSNIFKTHTQLDQTTLCNSLCAVLGDKTNRKHLQAALESNKKLEFYISQDLKNMYFQWSN